MNNFSLQLEDLDNIFPCFFVVEDNGKVVTVGKTMKKILANHFETPFDFSEAFFVRRPMSLNFEQFLKDHEFSLIILEIPKTSAEFKGQFMRIKGTNSYAFLMNLVAQSPDQLISLGLTYSDFPVHDPIFDFMMLLQTQRRSISHVQKLNQKLEESNKVALLASETKSRFLANMSHELRTPMNGLLGMASILLETELSVDQKEYVDILVKSGENMLALVNDILDLSKIEAGFIELESNRFDFRELANDIVNTLSPLAIKKKIKLNFNIEENVPQFIISDQTRLRQVLLNLTGNAVKFTEVGSVTLDATVVSISESDCKIKFKIQDTGIGMSQETVRVIFKPFVQGDDSMTKKFEGTGLGLSICKKLIERMNGEIDVTSEPGKGSIFTFTAVFDLPPK